MTGDDQSRFCGQCEKQVYNFSKMSQDAISELITEKRGGLCARFYQRKDGTVLLENCPVGADRIVRRIKFMVCSAAALFTVAAGALFVHARSINRAQTQSRIELIWDEAAGKIKGMLGIQQPPALLMGEICVIPPRTTSAVTVTNGNTSSQ